MTVECCPRCGDQTLWSHNRGVAWCRLCGHEWAYPPTTNVFRCEDPEADWIKEQAAEYVAELENLPVEEAEAHVARITADYERIAVSLARIRAYLEKRREQEDEQKREAAEARAEHWAEARAVEDHQERKHRDRDR